MSNDDAVQHCRIVTYVDAQQQCDLFQCAILFFPLFLFFLYFKLPFLLVIRLWCACTAMIRRKPACTHGCL